MKKGVGVVVDLDHVVLVDAVDAPVGAPADLLAAFHGDDAIGLLYGHHLGKAGHIQDLIDLGVDVYDREIRVVFLSRNITRSPALEMYSRPEASNTTEASLCPSAGKLPDMKETVLGWARFMQDYLPEEAGKKLLSMVEAVPHDDHMVHGDYHTKNVELQNDEVLLIDMDTLAVGHPIFELASMFNSFVGYSELDHEVIKKFQDFDFETGQTFWRKSLAAYLGTNCETKIREVEDKARIIGYTRMIRRSIRRKGLEAEEGRAEIAFWKEQLLSLLDKTDTLLFAPNELEIESASENLAEVQSFVDERLERVDCPPKAQMQIGVAVEEIFINIASYAYAPEKGHATVRVEVSEDPVTVTITFVDHGMPYDPLAKGDPNVTLPAEARQAGGLGIFMTKKLMDDVSYTYSDGKNILTLKKNL